MKLPDERDLNVWDVTMEGPADSTYVVCDSVRSCGGVTVQYADRSPQGARFEIQITLPKEYPFKPPTLSFRTKVYHPNVTNDERGAMCLGMLRPEEWKPPNKIADVLKLVRTVLAAPQPDDAVEGAIADQYKNDRKAFEKIARDWVAKYAK